MREGSRVTSTDSDLLRALHDEHADAVWRYVVGLTGGDRALAQDIVQETLLRAWRNPAVLAGDASPRGWLFTVAKRLVIDNWRAAQARPHVVTDDVPERPAADATDRALDRYVVVAALRTLSEEHRAVLVECYLRGATIAQAAATLGVPVGTVKSRLHYGLRALRLALEEMGLSTGGAA